VDENQRAAIHEGGHLIVNDHFGMESGSVYVIGSNMGQVCPAAWSKLPADIDQIVGFAAGVEAERIFGFPDPGPGSDQDAIGERTFARRAIRASRGGDWMDSAAVAAMVNRAHQRAYQLVQDHRDTIAAFAATLLANGGRLGGEEVSEALRHAVNGWPTPLFTAKAKHDRMLERRDIFESMVRPSMTPEQIAAAWSAADEAARSGKVPASLGVRRPVPISSGTDWYREAVARNQAIRLARARALVHPDTLSWVDAHPEAWR
jgi:hypothetical protein